MTKIDTNILLDVRGLSVSYPANRTYRKPHARVQVLEEISFNLKPGETVGVVGESGCGKSTLAKALVALAPAEGSATFNDIEIIGANSGEKQNLQKDIQIVFQDPRSSLNPRRPIWKIVSEPISIHTNIGPEDLKEATENLLRQVGLDDRYLLRYPHELSGGQRQRVAIARALALNPKLIIMDEPTSALDVSVQAQVINMLLDLQSKRGLSYLFISHDVSVVEHVSDRVAVLNSGRIVEFGETVQVFQQPQDDYTKTLLNSVPQI